MLSVGAVVTSFMIMYFNWSHKITNADTEVAHTGHNKYEVRTPGLSEDTLKELDRMADQSAEEGSAGGAGGVQMQVIGEPIVATQYKDVKVQVPAGATGTLKVNVDGRFYSIAVPPNATPNQTITVRVPVSSL